MLQIPIFHVNGEDPEAVEQVVTLALDYRREFKRDVSSTCSATAAAATTRATSPRSPSRMLYEQIRERRACARAT